MLTPKKSLGQNFLKNKQVAARIVAELNPQAADIILEIGPGTGVLTEVLIQTRGEIHAVDIDSRMTNFLAQKYAHAANLHLVNADILEFEIDSIAAGRRIKVIGNLPYHLTSPILERLCSYDNLVEKAVLTVQKEVAARIVAAPGDTDFSALTVFINNFCRAEKLFDLGKKQFHPPPKVDSSVIRLDFFSEALLDKAAFEQIRRLVKKFFSQRRKMIINSLMSAADLSRERAGQILSCAGIDKTARPQNISLKEYQALANELSKNETLP